MIVAGFGFRSGVNSESLADALARAAGAMHPDLFATIEAKGDDPAMSKLASQTLTPLQCVPRATYLAQETLTHSKASYEAHGTGSVAEAAALAAAGPGARLLGPRQISTDRMASCAIAIGETP